MAADSKHVEYIGKLTDAHQERLADSLVKLESRIANLVAEAPLREGALFDLEWAVNARKGLREAINEEYLSQVDSIVGDYSGVASRATKMLKEYGDFTDLDPTVISRLKKLTFQGFEEVGDQYLDAVAKEVYSMTLTGTSFADAVTNVKQVVSGGMAKHASQMVHDSLNQFNASVHVGIGKQAGATKWKYVGSADSANRSHCAKHVGKVYTEEEIADKWSGTWAGKASGSPFVVRGGFNCRHHWRPVFDEFAEDEEETVAEQPPTNAPKLYKKEEAEKRLTKKFKKMDKRELEVSGKVAKDWSTYPESQNGVPQVRFRPSGATRANWVEKARTRLDSPSKIANRGFSPELQSALIGTLKETEKLSKRFKVPNIRGTDYVAGEAAMAMGDGILSVSKKYNNPLAKQAYANKEKARKDLKLKIAKRRQLEDEYDKVQELAHKLEAKVDWELGGFDEVRATQAHKEYSKAKRNARKVADEYNIASTEIAELSKMVRGYEPSVYSKKNLNAPLPTTTIDYWEEPIDRIRAQVIHEYGHLVHQEYNRIGFKNARLEYLIDDMFKELPDKWFPSVYSKKNGVEWWAENFGAYNMGRKDLVDDRLKKVFDAIAKSETRIDIAELYELVGLKSNLL
jgi:hypothetical protein